jgi:hypothetical protein
VWGRFSEPATEGVYKHSGKGMTGRLCWLSVLLLEGRKLHCARNWRLYGMWRGKDWDRLFIAMYSRTLKTNINLSCI